MRTLVLLILWVAGTAGAQDWPSKSVRMVVPYAAGGLPDTMARLLGQRLAAAVASALAQPELARRYAQLGIEPVGSTPEAYAAAIRESYDKYAVAVRISGARAK